MKFVQKKLHDPIFGPKTLHIENAQIVTIFAKHWNSMKFNTNYFGSNFGDIELKMQDVNGFGGKVWVIFIFLRDGRDKF